MASCTSRNVVAAGAVHPAPETRFSVASVLQLQSVYYAYPPRGPGLPPVEVLRGIDLEIHPGELVALLGRIGAGKSTLCLAANGLVPRVTGGVFRGHVVAGGLNTRRHAVSDLARFAGLVFQDPDAQLTQMRVDDEVAFGPENLGILPAEIAQRLSWALGATNLQGFASRSPLRLSGGEKQRVTIAATLAMRPQLLVLDEPTSNLDPAGKAAVFGVLARLAREQGIGVLIATHDVERIARYASRAVVLEGGRIVADAAPARVFESVQRVVGWGIGAPQMAELADLVSRRAGRYYSFPTMSAAYAALHRKAHALADWQPREISSAVHARPIIELDNASFAYPDGTVALDGVSLVISRGEFVALVGPNGSGKTTLAKHLNGLLKPVSGRVLIGSQDTRGARVPELSRTVGYVFQNPDHQIFAPTVKEEIAFSLSLRGLPAPEVDLRTRQALDRHNLNGCASQPPALLGSGQRRQVAVAAVLATEPEVLVLDEPTGGLDRTSRAWLMAVVAEFHQRGGTAILVTHDMRLVAEYAQRVVVLLAGRVVFDGRPEALFSRHELVRRARLVLPPIVRLAQRLWGPDASRIASSRDLVDALHV